ncbi:uncharacterized protein L3040_003158 [Drepanopeziza brunnea f. sp. 'multigermtubi']|uniref:Helix-loop-helix DNA-binding domain-containing protein n=1 Tax=Marssonina brunnea f. sp. multigermtubi (strain MB_m1) TaxID=1072389 RepID=K1WIQ8_MARBU|nr:helix-loop-helix DNA-binding domain-containing protein [Drepanopeziza brunnea f. sp. 'multigermtubi' MB_m1]EKD12062.1 helix-loop-helix DNA-binding domain-containing protein [Drepanopeziza brunnea f. sp. 'multigermtubi' MB_m1]KAJ5047331.1 hypothetical protein L3040_003158 [Drepanopeziza brunnea f. sp. 'multigermtubi']
MDSRDSFDPFAISALPAGFDFNSFDETETETVRFTDTLALDQSQHQRQDQDQDLIFPADWDQESPPYDGNLYVTPLSWARPSEHRVEPKVEPKIEPVPSARYTTMNSLTPAQQEKLRNIAMPLHLQYRGLHSPQSTASSKSHSISSPDSHNDRGIKRKSSTDAEGEEDDDSNPPIKKTAHNMIEKRYRTNLNDKIAALRDSVPSLRIMTKSARGEDTADDREELQGLTPAHKLNKATVLSKATEYINHLEKRCKRLEAENAEQKARLAAFETLFRSGSMGFNQAHPMNSTFQFTPDYSSTGPPTPGMEPQGLISIPDGIRRHQSAGQMGQQAFSGPQETPYRQQAMGPNGWNSGYFGKLMVGSLAGLMILEGFSHGEQADDSPGARGLSALPLQLLKSLSSTLHSSLDVSALGYHVPAAETLGYMKLFFMLGAVVFVCLSSLFSPKPKPGTKPKIALLSAAPSLASSISVRRQAWLTAIQTVWVPRHQFLLEACALLLKMVKLSMRNVIGAQSYTVLTGITPEQEAARIKAWTIALDAQLTGGDVEVSKSRLTLTLLASGTLPDTPARLMLKALHIRVLLWEVGNAGFNGFYLFHEVAAKLARWKWNEAKQLHRLLSHTLEKQDDELPDYLLALLEKECDDVLVNSISQRAYNLAWNLPTTNNIEGSSDGMDGVVDDFAIRSPLEAVAAWYSSLVLQRALVKSLQSPSDDLAAQNSIVDDISTAIKTAPTGSRAHVRSLVARAVLVREKRGASIADSIKALDPLEKAGGERAPGLPSSSSIFLAGLPDAKMALRCAMATAFIERFPAPSNPVMASRIIRSISPSNTLTLLGFTAAFKLMERINGHDLVAASCSQPLEKLAGDLRIWIGGKNEITAVLDKEAKRDMIDTCSSILKRTVLLQDAGYETMSDEDDDESC